MTEPPTSPAQQANWPSAPSSPPADDVIWNGREAGSPPEMRRPFSSTCRICPACGQTTLPDANFCQSCGASCQVASSTSCTRKTFSSVAEMMSMVEGMHKGAATAVFEQVKIALHDAARAAAERINTNVSSLHSVVEDAGFISGLEAIGLMHAVPLKDGVFTGHLGHHNPQQAICHLLHLAVQLSLFPHGPMPSRLIQVGAPFSSLIPGEAQTDEPPKQCAVTVQTDPMPSPPLKRRGPAVGVRIGGGFHLLHTEEPEESPAQSKVGGNGAPEAAERGPSSSPAGGTTAAAAAAASSSSRLRGRDTPLSDVARETVRQCSSRSPSPTQPRSPFPEATSDGEADAAEAQYRAGYITGDASTRHPYGFGARSQGVPRQRFRVGAYETGSQGPGERVLSGKDARRRQHDHHVQLSRYLAHRSRPMSADMPHARMGSSRNGSRPVSARKEKLMVGKQHQMECGAAEPVYIGEGAARLPLCAISRRYSRSEPPGFAEP